MTATGGLESAGDRAALVGLGWTPDREAAFAPLAAAGHRAGRVTAAGRTIVAETARGPVEVILQRRSRREASSVADLPVVGDWLALEALGDPGRQAALRAVLVRTSRLTRAIVSASRPDAPAAAQVLAANVDLALLVTALGGDLNPRRLERFILAAMAGQVSPVVVVNKADLAPGEGVQGALGAVRAVAGEAPVLVVSARTGTGLAALRELLRPGLSACLLGSSGVGKSTLTNALLGERRQTVRDVRADDDRGRHTTTRRELFRLPWGALLIDTPGLRAIGLWDDGTGLAGAFGDVESFAPGCRFGDCRHEGEPGCAVAAAVARGDLPAERLQDMTRLARELRSQELRSDLPAARRTERRLGRMYRDASRATRWKGWQDG